MPLFFFKLGDSGMSGFENDLDVMDRDAAWDEMRKVCGDLIGDAVRGLKQNEQWQIELSDQSKKPVFRIRLVVETF
jgi:hypothetical protein